MTITLEQYKTVMSTVAMKGRLLTDFSDVDNLVSRFVERADFSLAALSSDLAWDNQEV
jgi:hypothetical protein